MFNRWDQLDQIIADYENILVKESEKAEITPLFVDLLMKVTVLHEIRTMMHDYVESAGQIVQIVSMN